MPDPAIVANTAFGRTLEDLFTAVPERGQAAIPGRTVPVVVGTALVEVPPVSGPAVQVEDAQKTLRDARLVPAVQFIETAGTENTVKEQDPPAGKFLAPGAQVTLFVVKHRELTPLEQVLAQLSAAMMAGQTPSPGGTRSVVAGTTLVEVPLVSGPTVQVEDAQKTLRDARLVPTVQLVETAGTGNTVKRQDPQEGSFVRPGSQVTLYVVTEREPGEFEQMVAAIRQAIKPEELARTADVQNLPSKADLHTATGALEREDAAKERFEKLKSMIQPNDGGGGGGPNSSKART